MPGPLSTACRGARKPVSENDDRPGGLRHPQDAIDRWIRPAVRNLRAYTVPEPAGLVKLDAMENPYAWPQSMVTEWLERLRSAQVNRYPDPQARDLKRRMREVMGVPEDLGVLFGNGSDELIQLAQLAVAGDGRTVMSPEPSFVMYRLIAAFTGSQYIGVALTDDFGLDVDAMVHAIRRHDPALVFIAYPNNPTANLFDREAVDTLIACTSGLLVIDEAYHPFAKQTFMNHPATRGNLLVMRTVSKLGLAGLRLGLLVGAPAWIEELEKIRLPYNINSLTQISADFALSRHTIFADQAARICAERDRVSARLGNRADLTVYPSDTNFLLLRCLAADADHVFAGLVEQGVLVKNLNGTAAALSHCLRVTIGTPEENEILLNALEFVLNSHGG